MAAMTVGYANGHRARFRIVRDASGAAAALNIEHLPAEENTRG
jgi:hypothetical protein